MRSSQLTRLLRSWKKQEILLLTLTEFLNQIRTIYDQNHTNETLGYFLQKAHALNLKLHAIFPGKTDNFRYAFYDLTDLIIQLQSFKTEVAQIDIRLSAETQVRCQLFVKVLDIE